MEKFLESIIKGWVTTIIALLGLIAIIAHATGYVEFPNPEFMSKKYESIIGALICLVFLRLPRTLIDGWIESIASTGVDSVKSLIKKKGDTSDGK